MESMSCNTCWIDLNSMLIMLNFWISYKNRKTRQLMSPIVRIDNMRQTDKFCPSCPSSTRCSADVGNIWQNLETGLARSWKAMTWMTSNYKNRWSTEVLWSLGKAMTCLPCLPTPRTGHPFLYDWHWSLVEPCMFIPVVPHNVVAEVLKIGNL